MNEYKKGDFVKITSCSNFQPDRLVGMVDKIDRVEDDWYEVDGWWFKEYDFERSNFSCDTVFTAPEPQPACKQNQEYMLEKLGRGWVDTNKLDPKDKIKLIKNPQDKIPSLREYYNVPDEQQELDRDAKLWDAVQDLDES